MQFQPAELINVLKKNFPSYLLWLLANVGGLLIAYAAIYTIYIVNGSKSSYSPSPIEYLLIGAITLAMSEISYVTFHRETDSNLNPFLQISGWVSLGIIYSVIVLFCTRTYPSTDINSWRIALPLFVVCLGLSTITWLHEQGIRSEISHPQTVKSEAPKSLIDSTNNLPKTRAHRQRKG